jgi:hypothetical protein
MLLAMDYFYDESGNCVPSRTVFQVPNDYAAEVAEQHAGRCEWIASIALPRQRRFRQYGGDR